MNTPEREYGYDTAITPDEIKALGKPKIGDHVLVDGLWTAVTKFYLAGYAAQGNAIRRPIDPGEGWEIVPETETKMEYRSRNGFLKWEGYGNGEWMKMDSIQSDTTYRRRKTVKPDMEGWELVSKEEVKASAHKKQPTWEYSSTTGSWRPSYEVIEGYTYRRPKSKPEQYGWLKPDCGVEMPKDGTYFDVRLENSLTGRVYYIALRQQYVWASNGIPLLVNIAWWHRMEPAPEVVKVDPMEERAAQFAKLSGADNLQINAYKCGWIACKVYMKAEQEKGSH